MTGKLLVLCYLVGLKFACAQTVNVRQNPVVFTATGTIINSGSHYVIPLRLDVLSLLVQIEPLEDTLKRAFNHYSELANLLGRNSKKRELSG